MSCRRFTVCYTKRTMITPTTSEEINYKELRKLLSAAKTEEDLAHTIVNAPMEHFKVEAAFLFLGIIVLLTVNKKQGTIDRIALSDTALAAATKQVSAKRFEDIKIPLEYQKNIIAAAIQTNEPQDTTDWRFLFEPALTKEEARINQANAGIAYSAVYPLQGLKDGGALIFSYFQYPENIGKSQKKFMEKYTKLVSDTLKSA
jgi:hypothetical protein